MLSCHLLLCLDNLGGEVFEGTHDEFFQVVHLDRDYPVEAPIG